MNNEYCIRNNVEGEAIHNYFMVFSFQMQKETTATFQQLPITNFTAHTKNKLHTNQLSLVNRK